MALSLLLQQEGICTIPKVPFRGAPCSDASGKQIPYSIMMKQINSSISGRLWDENQRAPYYNYKVLYQFCMCLIKSLIPTKHLQKQHFQVDSFTVRHVIFSLKWIRFYLQDTEGRVHQVWYDDPESIALKAAYVAQRGLRGIGMWNGNILDYSSDPVAQQQTVDMWNALTPGDHRESSAAVLSQTE